MFKRLWTQFNFPFFVIILFWEGTSSVIGPWLFGTGPFQPHKQERGLRCSPVQLCVVNFKEGSSAKAHKWVETCQSMSTYFSSMTSINHTVQTRFVVYKA